MSEKYYMNLDESLADDLAQMDDSKIIEALESLVEAESKSESELAAYDSVKEIMNDTSLSPGRRKQLRIKAQRLHSFPTR